jgi:tRNA nucleotidyltransferase (CCA-adding enzyme)
VSNPPLAGAAIAGADVLRALGSQPGGPQMLRLGRGREDVALVGGAVRDLLLGRTPRELDVVVGRDAAAFAEELASSLGASTTLHGRFGTAVVEWEDGRIDVAQRRAEAYPAPGALPEVRPGTVQEDLRRRDFTVNAIAVALGGATVGELAYADHALEDLAAGRLRVLHERSFLEDPTRLLRLARYRARLRFEADAATAELAARAVADGALSTVSPARVGSELRLALRELDALLALEGMEDLGVLAALDPRLHFDGALARSALALLSLSDSGQGLRPRAEVLLLAALLQPAAAAPEQPEGASLATLVNELEFAAGEQALVLAAAAHAQELAEALARTQRPSQIHRAASHASSEAVALAGALGERAGPPLASAATAARQWLSQLRSIGLAITGEDLIVAGIPEGPDIGRRLEAALLRKLDGELGSGGRQAELEAALQARA